MVLPSIQALRFIATLLVLLFHMALLPTGFKGVDLFFVISGFVLFYNYHARPASIRSQRRRYFIHRLTKIFLLYWTALIARYLVVPFPFNTSLIASVLLLPGHNPILSISWSLSCELYFYGLLGITLFYIPTRWHKGLFIGAFALTAGVKLFNTWFFSLHGLPIYFLAGPNLWEFLCGILAGYLFCWPAVSNPSSPSTASPSKAPPSTAFPSTASPGISFPFLLFSLLLLALFWFLPLAYSFAYYHFVYGSVALLLVLMTARSEKRRPWNGPFKDWVLRLGNASYAIYLFGPVLVHALRPHIHELPWKIGAMFTLVVFSLLINHFYEEPLLRIIRNAFTAKKNALPKTASPL
jgi:peptidoglycan/LPS O-acetylase OafA/YrhL